MFTVTIGEKGLSETSQEKFPKETTCCRCDGTARIGFVVIEDPTTPGDAEACSKENFVCNLHPNDPGGDGYWLHDCCAVAVYFCKECLETTALYNQA